MWHTECAPYTYGASHVALVVKNQPASAEYVRDVGWITESGRSLGRARGNHSSILARRIPWTEEPGRLHSVGSQRVGHYWSDLTYTHTYTYCPNSAGSIKILQHYTYFPFFLLTQRKILLFVSLAALSLGRGMWDLPSSQRHEGSSLTRDATWAPCIGSSES